MRGKVSRSTLADANENRDWRIYSDFAQVLIRIARDLYANDKFGVELDQTVYALDSTTIDLCLSLFPWARFRKHKGAIKLHTLMDLRGNIPSFIRITEGRVHDVNILMIQNSQSRFLAGYQRQWGDDLNLGAQYYVEIMLSITFGGNVFGGTRETTFLGQFDKNDNTFLSARFDF